MHRAVQKSSTLLTRKPFFHDFAEDMEKELLHLLNTGCLASRNNQLDVGGTLGKSPPLAKKRYRLHPMPARLFQSGKNIPRLAAGGDHDQDIARLPESRHLSREDLGELIVVTDRREESGIDGEGHRRIGTPVFLKAAGELSGQMSAVAGAAAVAAEHQLVTRQKRIAGKGGGFFKVGL